MSLRDLCKGLGCSTHTSEQGKEAETEASKSVEPKADSKMLQKDLKSDRVKNLQMKFSTNRHQVMHRWRNGLWSKSTAMGSKLSITSVETDQES